MASFGRTVSVRFSFWFLNWIRQFAAPSDFSLVPPSPNNSIASGDSSTLCGTCVLRMKLMGLPVSKSERIFVNVVLLVKQSRNATLTMFIASNVSVTSASSSVWLTAATGTGGNIFFGFGHERWVWPEPQHLKHEIAGRRSCGQALW